TPKGLAALSGGRFRVYTARDGLPSDEVTCILADPGGVVWIGTGNGLAFLRSGRVERPRPEPTRWQEQVLGLAQDQQGWLWRPPSGRVVGLGRQALLWGLGESMDVRESGVADGLLGIAGVTRPRSVVADRSGRIWLSMDRGLSVIDPAQAGRD